MDSENTAMKGISKEESSISYFSQKESTAQD